MGAPHTYGHALRFGVEVVATPGQAGAAAELAVKAEAFGYDTVGFADRPDDGGTDAWTLATWAAARTERMQIAATGLRGGDRPASIVARAAASLQLFSAGRASLVLTAGEEPAEIAELAEAVAVIGAQPGPALERAVPVWLLGAGRSLAALAGRVADGIVVDLEEVGPSGLAAVNAAVDRAATEAGRDPREIRRAVIIGSEIGHAAALTALAVEQGVSTFLLRVTGSEIADEVLLKEFITLIAPVVRAGAEQALPPGALTARAVRRADVRAQRRPGIAYDEVAEDLAERAVEPGDAAYARVRSTYLRGGSPGLVLRPTSVDEVRSALAFARTHTHVPLGIRSGGHGISGRSTNDGGLVIDVGSMNDVIVLDEARRLVRIEPGARWRDVATVLESHGWALSSGDYGGVGVGGLATAGGIGFLNRKHGLTIDHLQAVEMVLADGTLVRASADENPELFWAARGAGANFGIAVAFEFTVDEVGDVGWAQLAFQVADPAAYLEAFGEVMAVTPRETTPFLILGNGMAQMMAMVDSSDPDVIIGQLQPFAEIAPLVQQQVVIAPYSAVMNMFPEAPHSGRGEPVSRSVLVREITPEFAQASADLIASGASHWYQIRTVGGAVSDVASDATAYAHRDANFSLTVMGANAQRLDRWFDPVRRHSDGLYLSFESDPDPERVLDAFPPVTLERLRRLKAQLDPHNLFQDNFNITPRSAR